MSDKPAGDDDAADDLVPVSVRLGEVVPPDDPEDWTRPLTWGAAAGMLLGPLVAAAWFWASPPADASLQAGTPLLAGAVAAGAVLTGATQQGGIRALTATLGAALFAAMATVLVGAIASGERQVGSASPSLGQAFGAGLAGLAGAAAAAPLAAALARLRSGVPRLVAPGAVAIGVALLLLPVVFGLSG